MLPSSQDKPESIISLERIIAPIPLKFELQGYTFLDYEDTLSRETATEICVGWGKVGVLIQSEPQDFIYTAGVASCYIICGMNLEGDIVLGHFNGRSDPNTSFSAIEETVASIPQKRAMKEFSFFTIPGPDNTYGRDNRYFNYKISVCKNPLILRVIAYDHTLEEGD